MTLGLASSLFLQEREVSAIPFSASFSHSRSSVEKSTARSQNNRKASRDSGSVHGSQIEREKFCLNKEIFILSLRGKLIEPELERR